MFQPDLSLVSLKYIVKKIFFFLTASFLPTLVYQADLSLCYIFMCPTHSSLDHARKKSALIVEELY